LLSGFELKQLREAYGIELTEIYAITRINADILTRIETNQFDDLPAKVYLRHFLKTYAELLHLDPARVADSYLKCMHLNQPDH
jgi:cytoskeleton protein RodZ